MGKFQFNLLQSQKNKKEYNNKIILIKFMKI